MVLLGIGAQRRIPVTAGGAAIAMAAVWSLTQVAQTIPIYAFFAGIAMALLGLATLLALARPSVDVTRQHLGRAWEHWR